MGHSYETDFKLFSCCLDDSRHSQTSVGGALAEGWGQASITLPLMKVLKRNKSKTTLSRSSLPLELAALTIKCVKGYYFIFISDSVRYNFRIVC